MVVQEVRRKLTAILSADVKGYSRLMGEDEVGTAQTLTAHKEVMGILIQHHRGRVVDAPGDNLLSEFASVVDAVQCAVEIQKELKLRNAGLPGHRRMEFRIGINLGDVVEEGNRIYGDGVNLTARVEDLAEGGGICISGTAYDHLKNKLALGYEYLGEHTVKNIAEPVRIYRILMEPEAVGKLIDKRKPGPRRCLRTAFIVVAILIVGVAAIVLWHSYLRFTRPGVASKEKMASPLPDKPSIAVLPFTNLSGDAQQEYFSDGITNDIITDLSKFEELFVIAGNSVFTYKGKDVKVQQVSKELAVRYVLEGSVQKSTNKVRINAQLVDGTTGHHLWAERYERDLKNLFVVQDEIVQTIVRTLSVKIDRLERVRAMQKKTQSLEAYDYLLRGWEHYYRYTRSENLEAQRMFEKSIELDPTYASAYVALGWCHRQSAIYGWNEFPDRAFQKAYDLAQKALNLEESNASAHRLLGAGYLRWAQYDLAVAELHRAIELNPNDALSRQYLGEVLLYSGKADEAIQSMEIATRFDPSSTPGFVMELGLAYYLAGKDSEAIRTVKRDLGRWPDFVGNHVVLAAAYARSGQAEDAAREASVVLRLDPFFDLESYGTMFKIPADRKAILEGLRKAGLK